MLWMLDGRDRTRASSCEKQVAALVSEETSPLMCEVLMEVISVIVIVSMLPGGFLKMTV